MGPYYGDFLPRTQVRLMIDTFAAAGGSINPSAGGTIVVHKDLGTTESTSGVSYTNAPFDSRTGIGVVTIDTSADATFYSAGGEFQVLLHTATVDGQTVQAHVGSFSILRDAITRGILRFGVAAGIASTTIDLDSGAPFVDDGINECWISAFGPTQGYWQTKQIDDYVQSTKRATVKAWPVTPSGSPILFLLSSVPPAGAIVPDVRPVDATADFFKRFYDLNTTLTMSNIVSGSLLHGLNAYVQDNQPRTLYRNLVQTVNSQTSMVLTAPVADDLVYERGCVAVFTDASNPKQKSSPIPIIAFTSTSPARTVTLLRAPEFTVVAGDTITVEALTPSIPNVLPNTNTGLPIVDANGKIPGLQAGGIDDFFNKVIEGAVTYIQSVRLANAALGGLVTGANTNAPKFRDLANTKDRISATTDANGNRLTVTRDLT